jgi:P27 family predicted phage terminase small subunit
MPGRPPKSAAAKKAAGNPGKRPIKENIAAPPLVPAAASAAAAPAAVTVQPINTAAPAWVANRPGALAQWAILAPEMIARKTLTLFDVNRFGRYCILMAIFLDTISKVEKFGTLTEGTAGKSGAITVLMDLDKVIRPLEEQFGFSPVSRNKLFASEGDEGLSPEEKELRALEGGT